MRTRYLYLCLSLSLVVFQSVSALADVPEVRFYIPELLKPWLTWVAEKNPDFGCASVRAGAVCAWPGSLQLELTASGGTFVMKGSVDRRTLVPLPGGPGSAGDVVWPQAVMVTSSGTSAKVTVFSVDEVPQALIEKGGFSLEGRFQWERMPEQLRVPLSFGLISAKVEGTLLRRVRQDANGLLMLREPSTGGEEEAESVAYQVFRRLEDGMPFRVVTHVDFRISGRARELRLDHLVPEAAVVTAIRSDLAYRLMDGNILSFQARPGTYTMQIDSYMAETPKSILAQFSSLPGGADQEIWVWAADTALRTVQLSGAAPIDPARTSLPSEWRGLPTYALESGTRLQLLETRRGQQELAPNHIGLQRRLWLDQTGRGFTSQDRFNISMHQGWRLNAGPALHPGRVVVNNEESLITEDPVKKLAGVELRSEQATVVAESRIEPQELRFSASGWAHEVDALGAVLLLPPGWRLLGARGVDSLSGSWLSAWTLFDLFVVILVAVACGKLFGLRWGIVALVGLVLSHAEIGAPMLVWCALLVFWALSQVLTEPKLRRVTLACYWLSVLALVILLVPFIIVQIRSGLFPQLENADVLAPWGALLLGGVGVVGGGVGAVAVLVLAVMAITALIRKNFRGFARYAAAAVGLALGLMVLGALGTYLGLRSAGRVQQQFAQVDQSLQQMAQTMTAPMEAEVEESYRDRKADRASQLLGSAPSKSYP